MKVKEKILKRLIFGPIGVRVMLSMYCFLLLVSTQYLSIARDGFYNLIKEYFVILIICLILVEILNQITFYLGEKNYKNVVVIRAILFWLIFTAGIGIYVYLLLGIKKNVAWSLHTELGHFLIYLITSLILPQYSLSTNIRFLFLRGKFGAKEKT